MDPLIVAAWSVAGTLVVLTLILLALAGGNPGTLAVALTGFRRLLSSAEFRARVKSLEAPPPPPRPPEPPKPVRPSGVPLRMLALLQREGRLLDFLLEDVQNYGDAQIGAAVRDIHRKCRTAIQEHLVLEPVLSQSEGAQVDVPRGFDPSAIRMVGNVVGEPPYKGILQHHGWRVKEIKLAPPPEGQDELVLQPAEVEMQ